MADYKTLCENMAQADIMDPDAPAYFTDLCSSPEHQLKEAQLKLASIQKEIDSLTANALTHKKMLMVFVARKCESFFGCMLLPMTLVEIVRDYLEEYIPPPPPTKAKRKRPVINKGASGNKKKAKAWWDFFLLFYFVCLISHL